MTLTFNFYIFKKIDSARDELSVNRLVKNIHEVFVVSLSSLCLKVICKDPKW